jgi:hypothetical protein
LDSNYLSRLTTMPEGLRMHSCQNNSKNILSD